MFLVFFNKRDGVKAISVSPKPQLLTLKLDLMKRITVLLGFLVLLGLQVVFAQTKQITGTVTSAEDGMGIPGVSVVVKGTTIGTTTDIDGNYTLNIPQDATTIVFTFVGLKTIEMPADKNVINVVMSADTQELDEVVVVAYGTTTKQSFTGSAEVISAKKLEKRTVSNVTKAIDGLATGVLTTSGSGQPGSSVEVIIRGFGSINASQTPLYVVDGVPYEGALNALNPADIESMSVLKDASAGALYGSRGANGVVVITTKKGSKKGDEMRVNFKGTWGVSQRAIPAYNMLNEKEWMEYEFQAYKNYEIYNNGVDPTIAGATAINSMISGTNSLVGGTSQIYNPFNYSLQDLIDPTTGKVRSDATLKWSDNWMDEAMNSAPSRSEYVMSVTGGNEKASYMVSMGYLDETGLLKTTEFTRFSGRVNVDASPKEWFKVGLNSSFAQTESSYLSATGTSTSNVFYSAMTMGPLYPIYQRDADGKFILDAAGKKQFDYGQSRPSGAQSNYNSIATLFNDKFSLNNDNVSARGYMSFLDLKEGVLQGLKFTMNLGVDYVSQLRHTYENPFFGNAAGSKGRTFRYNYRTHSYTFNQLLTYNRTFADVHKIDLLLGHENYQYKFNYLRAGKTGFPFGGIYELDGASTVYDASSYIDEYALESYMSRLNYSYNDRYYFSASFRTDGSSRFHKDSRWGKFWSVGANWRISEEAFMEGLDWLDNMSVRASYGLQGNDKVGGYYPWQALYTLGYPNAGASGAIVGSLENKDLMWETNKNLNIGVEGRFLNRFSASIEWYKRYTADMLMNYPIALSLGFTGYDKNIGEMTNSGLEMSFTAEVIQTDDFRWSLGLMGSTVTNEVTQLADKPEITDGNYIIKEGEVLYSFYLPKSAGVDPATGKQLYWVWDGDDKDNQYISADATKALQCRQLAGSRVPDLYGSISNEFSYKGFDLSILCTYSLGGKVLDGTYNGLMYPMYMGGAVHEHAKRAWTNPGDVTDIPMPIIGTTKTTTDADLVNASYFSIKNITLGYSLPKRLAKSISVDNIRIAAVADNIALFTHLKGMDPQYNFTGGTAYTYTPTRTVSLSLDLTF